MSSRRTGVRSGDSSDCWLLVSRKALVVEKAAELISIGARYGAHGICLCGSVARGQDSDARDSDFDFFVNEFEDPQGPDARTRADALVREFRAALAPYRVDVRPLPGWFLDPPFEASMREDLIALTAVV